MTRLVEIRKVFEIEHFNEIHILKVKNQFSNMQYKCWIYCNLVIINPTFILLGILDSIALKFYLKDSLKSII